MPEHSLVNLSFNEPATFEKSHKFSIKYSFNNRKSTFLPSSIFQIKNPHPLKSNLATHKFSYGYEILPHSPYYHFLWKNSTCPYEFHIFEILHFCKFYIKFNNFFTGKYEKVNFFKKARTAIEWGGYAWQNWNPLFFHYITQSTSRKFYQFTSCIILHLMNPLHQKLNKTVWHRIGTFTIYSQKTILCQPPLSGVNYSINLTTGTLVLYTGLGSGYEL